jgi:glutaredoxin-like protein NrdH
MSNENKLPVVVYTKPGCVQCNATYRWLDENKIRYRVIDVSQDADALEKVKAMGYQGAPVVIVPFDRVVSVNHWYGFNPEYLKQLL